MHTPNIVSGLSLLISLFFVSRRELHDHPSFHYSGHTTFTNINREEDLSFISRINRSDNPAAKKEELELVTASFQTVTIINEAT
jgi:hypothetical protein